MALVTVQHIVMGGVQGMIADGLMLMITGMAVVFVFLSLLVGMMLWAARILAPHAHIFSKNQTTSGVPGRSTTDDVQIAVAIAALEVNHGK